MRIDILGVGLDVACPERVRSWLDEAIRGADGERCAHVVTLNPEYVELARRDEEFRAAVESADLVTADGVGVLIAARLLGGSRSKGLTRITGVDLCEWLAEICAAQGASLYLLGGRDGAAVGAARALGAGRQGLRVAGTWEGGSAAASDDAESLARIAASGARVVLVAYGAPGQVTWIARNQHDLGRAGVRLAVGVGGAFDMLSGRVPRAPRLVRRLGLEWLYRLMRQPWRWRRQAALPRFAARLLGEVAGRQLARIGRGPAGSKPV